MAGTLEPYTLSCQALTIGHLRFWKAGSVTWNPAFQLCKHLMIAYVTLFLLMMDTNSTGKMHKNLEAL